MLAWRGAMDAASSPVCQSLPGGKMRGALAALLPRRAARVRVSSMSGARPTRSRAGVGWCETRQDTWRIKRTREGRRLTGKAPSKTMGAMTEGTRDVDGCDDGGKGREGSQAKRLSFGTEAALLDPSKGTRIAGLYTLPGAPKVPQNMHALVSRPCGTTRTKNEGRRSCAATTRHQMAQKRRKRNVEKASGLGHESREQRALPIG